MGPWEVTGALANGAALALYEGAPDHPGPDRLWSFVERHGVTILGISPTLVRSLLPHGDEPVREHDLSGLRILGSTGEPWNEGPWRWYFEVVGAGRCPVINISGGTEVGACFLSPHPVQPIKPMSLGGPALGMAVDVYGDDGGPLRGEVGELVCTRPWPGMTRGLYGDPERYLDTYWSRWPGVWVHGDWASIDEDGDWFLHGRSDDTIKVAGKRLGPAEVESILVSHPAVVEAAAVGMPDEVKGESLWGFVVLAPGAEGDERLRASLCDLVAERLGKSFRPATVRFVAALPKTRNAKVLRRAVRAAATGKDPGDLSSLEDPGAGDGGASSLAGADGAPGAAPAPGTRGLRGVAGGATALPGVAHRLGAAAAGGAAGRGGGPARLRGALRRPRARAAAGDGLRVRRLRGRAPGRRDQPERHPAGALPERLRGLLGR
jgi:acetyl-CoA synthetase